MLPRQRAPHATHAPADAHASDAMVVQMLRRAIRLGIVMNYKERG